MLRLCKVFYVFPYHLVLPTSTFITDCREIHDNQEKKTKFSALNSVFPTWNWCSICIWSTYIFLALLLYKLSNYGNANQIAAEWSAC